MRTMEEMIPDLEDLLKRPAARGGSGQGPATAPAPTPFTAPELLAMQLPAPKWAIPGILPEGLTIFGGKPKMGKSWLMLGAAIAVASGGKALGQVDVAAGDVLYLALEDNTRRLQSRLRTLLADSPAPARLHFEVAWPRLHEGGLAHLDAWLDDHPDARLVVVDTLAKIRAEARGNGTLYTEDYASLSGLKSLADEHGIALVVIHHLRKMEAEDPLDTLNGTLGLTGAADGVLVLKRERGSHDAAMYVTGRDLDDAELALGWDPTRCLWSLLGDAEQYRQSEGRREILRLLADALSGLSAREVAETLQRPYEAVRQQLWQMDRAGQVRKTGSHYLPMNPNNPNNPHSPNVPNSPNTPPLEVGAMQADPSGEGLAGVPDALTPSVSIVSVVRTVRAGSTEPPEAIPPGALPLGEYDARWGDPPPLPLEDRQRPDPPAPG